MTTTTDPMVSQEVIDAVSALPAHRDVRHCGTDFTVSPFAIYAECPICRTRVKVRAFSAAPEVEDLFDAVFQWMNQPGAMAVAKARMAEIEADSE